MGMMILTMNQSLKMLAMGLALFFPAAIFVCMLIDTFGTVNHGRAPVRQNKQGNRTS
jgi:hypothetical protein